LDRDATGTGAGTVMTTDSPPFQTADQMRNGSSSGTKTS
jgi:hypothetical protein